MGNCGQARTVALPHCVCGNGKRLRERLADSLALIAQEEKRFVLEYRTTQAPAELILAERRYGSGCGVEEVFRIENVVADELEQAAVTTVRSRSAHDVDHRPGLASEFRSIGRLLDIELFDGVNRRSDHQVIEVLIGYGDAIHQIQIVSAALPQDVDQVAGLLHRVPSRSPWRPDDALAQHCQIEKLPPLEGQV